MIPRNNIVMTTTEQFAPYINSKYWLEWYKQQVQKSILTWISSGIEHYRGYGRLQEPHELMVTAYGKSYYIHYDTELLKGSENSFEHPLIYKSLTLGLKSPLFVWTKENEHGDGNIDLNFIEDQNMLFNTEMPKYSLPEHAAEQMRDLWKEWCQRVEQYNIYNRCKKLVSRASPAVRPMEPTPPPQSASLMERHDYMAAFRQYTSLLFAYGQNISDALELEVLDQQRDKSITMEEIQKCSTFFGYFLSKCKDDMTRLRHLMCYIDIRQIDSGR